MHATASIALKRQPDADTAPLPDTDAVSIITRQLGERLLRRIADHTATVGVVGLGYVGLPLVCLIAEAGYPTLGFDTDKAKIEKLLRGESYIAHIASARINTAIAQQGLQPRADLSSLRDADVIVVCVPTPLTPHREPDMQFIELTGQKISESLRSGQLVILESSTYPGTTREVLKPILEQSGLQAGRDFFLAYSPEREDPGNLAFSTATVPKIVGGDGALALDIANSFYKKIVSKTVPVRDPETAELAKLTENIFRAVNIALVNELKVICTAMGIDVWEVIEAASTKPFGFMPFHPGPGLGGHCIPVDPFYLTWKAREFGINTKFIELAGEVNASMPRFVIDRLTAALSAHQGRAIRDARILLLGLAYKKNVDDLRESPALAILELLEARGANVVFHDPHIPVIGGTRDHPGLRGRFSRDLTEEEVSAADAVVIVTDHEAVDYGLLARHARLIVDTRNAMERAGYHLSQVIKA